MSSLFHEYLELLENAIKRMKKEYPYFIVYIMAITTEENHNRSYISFDLKENSLKRLQEWEKSIPIGLKLFIAELNKTKY